MILIYLCCYVAAAVLAAVAPWRFYPHYTILIAPAIALTTGAVLHSRRGRDTLRYALVLTAAIAVAQLAFYSETRWTFESGLEGWAHWLNHEPSDSLAEIAQEVRLCTHRGDYIFATNTHELYILSDTRSPTRFAFGGDLWKSNPGVMRIFGTTPADELDRVLALHPKLIVKIKEGAAPREVQSEYLRKLAAALASKYQYLKRIGRVDIYRLRPLVVHNPESFLRSKPDRFIASSPDDIGDVVRPWPYQGLLREWRRDQSAGQERSCAFPQYNIAYHPSTIAIGHLVTPMNRGQMVAQGCAETEVDPDRETAGAAC